MHVTGQNASLGKTFPTGRGLPALDAVGRPPTVVVNGRGRNFRIMELMPARRLPGGAPQAIRLPGNLGVAQRFEFFQHYRLDRQHPGQRIAGAIASGQRTPQVHQTAAFGVNTHSRSDEMPQLVEHGPVVGQLRGM